MEATGIYMVEPQYMDEKRHEAEKRASLRTEKSKTKKRARDVPDVGNGRARKRVQSLDEGAGPSAQDGSETQAAQPADKLIVREDRHPTYEAAAMETYINARERGICRRKVSDEFFGNSPGAFYTV